MLSITASNPGSMVPSTSVVPGGDGCRRHRRECAGNPFQVTPNGVGHAGGGVTPITTKVIISHHDYEGTPDFDAMVETLSKMWSWGADVAKIATTATDVADAVRVLGLLEEPEGAAAIGG
jgi:Type I 3-dehydroquinase